VPLPANAPILTEDALDDDFLYEAIFAHVSDVTVKTSITGRNIEIMIESECDRRSGRRNQLRRYSGNVTAARREVRRLVHYLRWRQKDPVTRLPLVLRTG
jgi:hypothetical protein